MTTHTDLAAISALTTYRPCTCLPGQMLKGGEYVRLTDVLAALAQPTPAAQGLTDGALLDYLEKQGSFEMEFVPNFGGEGKYQLLGRTAFTFRAFILGTGSTVRAAIADAALSTQQQEQAS